MATYLSEFLVFIGSSIVLVPIFRRLGFGSVLGYLIAGILVGPYGLKLIRDAESVAELSEFGVVFLLFMIGLEIQPRKLWSMRRNLFGLGGLQIFLCSIAFFGLGCFWGLTPFAAAVAGFALSLSSTAFAVQNLTEKKVFETEFGRASFATLLMQDLVAIPALAFIPVFAVSGEGSLSHPSPKLWLAVLMIAALVGVSRFLIRPIFRMIATSRSRDLFTGVTLFIVLGVAGLMQIVGLSAALGTFIAGVLLSDSEYSNELEANLEPFKALLMGLFFIAVGMGVNINLVVEIPSLMIGLTTLYIAVKFIFIYLAGRGMKLNHSNSKMMALTIAQGGEFAFVIFGMIAQLSLVESRTLAILTFIVTASMAVTPLLNMLNEKISQFWHRENMPEYDQIKDETPDVIIAGFGRFGQIFGRILRAQSIPFVAIDHDAGQIELLRKFGNKVYYGDVTREEILEAAGAPTAKFFILAIDDIEDSVAAAQIIRKNFPHLRIFARARNRGHVYDLMTMGIQNIKRETFDSSVFFVRDLLVEMGFETSAAHHLIEKFRVHDEIMLRKQFLVRKDGASLLSVSQQGAAQLAEILREESLQSNINITEH